MGCFQQLGRHDLPQICWCYLNKFQRTHLPTTPYDNAIDRLSINPRFQAFEKFISGMYLGEITRNVLVALIDATPKSLLFEGKSTPVLNKHYGLDTSFMSATEEAWIGTDESQEAFNLPPLGSEFKRESLSPVVVKKLDDIRQVIVKFLGFREEDVSLKDAAVGFPLCCSSSVVSYILGLFSLRLCAGHLRLWLGGQHC